MDLKRIYNLVKTCMKDHIDALDHPFPRFINIFYHNYVHELSAVQPPSSSAVLCFQDNTGRRQLYRRKLVNIITAKIKLRERERERERENCVNL